jgi:hypothetical protein
MDYPGLSGCCGACVFGRNAISLQSGRILGRCGNKGYFVIPT